MLKFPSIRGAALLHLALAAPAQAALPASYCPTQTATIAVVGDSLADGLWGGLYRLFLGCQTVSVLRVTSVSDGLTKTAPEDWTQRLADALGETSEADVVLVQIGANDIQAIRDGSSRVVFRDPSWDRVYAERAMALAGQLAESAQELVWLGLPVVGNENLEPDYLHVTSLQQGAVTAAAQAGIRAAFVDIHASTMFGSGAFTQNGDVDGGLKQLRASDQIHFTDLGYNLVLGMVWPQVEAVLKAKDADAALDSVALQ